MSIKSYAYTFMYGGTVHYLVSRAEVRVKTTQVSLLYVHGALATGVVLDKCIDDVIHLLIERKGIT